MLRRCIISLLLLIICSCSEKIKPLSEEEKLNAKNAVKEYFKAFICRDHKLIVKFYAPSVHLLGDHVVLGHGRIHLEKNQDSDNFLDRDELVSAYSEIISDIPTLSRIEVNDFVEKMNIEILSLGPNVINVETGFKPLMITVGPEEILFKLTTPNNPDKNVMTILQMKLIENEWKIVAEYLSPFKAEIKT